MRWEGLYGLHVTGGVVSKERNSVPKLCVNYKSDIIQVYRLNINGDDTDRHLTRICNRCYTMMKKALEQKM